MMMLKLEKKHVQKEELFNTIKHVNICGVRGMATFTDDDEIIRREFNNLKSYFEKLKDSKNIYHAHLDNEKNINEKLEILKIKNNKIKILNPTKNEYEELLNKRKLNKNIKK